MALKHSHVLNLCRHFRRQKAVDIPITSSAMHAQWKKLQKSVQELCRLLRKSKFNQPFRSPGSGDKQLYSLSKDVLLVNPKPQRW